MTDEGTVFPLVVEHFGRTHLRLINLKGDKLVFSRSKNSNRIDITLIERSF